jgi:hypothetical protein
LVSRYSTFVSSTSKTGWLIVIVLYRVGRCVLASIQFTDKRRRISRLFLNGNILINAFTRAGCTDGGLIAVDYRCRNSLQLHVPKICLNVPCR